MRINVYAEEITDRIEVVEKTADTGAVFKGLRFYLESSPKLHHRPDDDDSTAITFWIRSSKTGFVQSDADAMLALLDKARTALAGRKPNG